MIVLSKYVRMLLAIALIFSPMALALAQSPVIGAGSGCTASTNCPATNASNTFTQAQTFEAGWYIFNSGNGLVAAAPAYSPSTFTFDSYYNYDGLIADGHGQVVIFLAYAETPGQGALTDAAAGDTELNAQTGGSVRIGFVGNSPNASSIQFSTTAANFNSIPVETSTLTLGGVPIVQSATQPTGACSTISWDLSNDGHLTFCSGTTWISKV